LGDGTTTNETNPVQIMILATLPGTPTNVSATAGNGLATVSFTPPGSSSGGPIISYTVTSSPDHITATGTQSPISITGLTNGTPYTFSVKATNVYGTGQASTPSNSVTPCAIPVTWYLDSDGDGYGDPTVSNMACTQPVGYVANNLDNCPNTANSAQEDIDHDGVGDVCDACPDYDDKVDVDGNGTPDYCQDSDNDLMSDGWERAHGMDPHVNDLTTDTDHNGVLNALEDLDNDGYSTLREWLAGTNPLPPYGNTDSPFDVNPGFSDLDKDGDMDGLDLSGCALEFNRTDCGILLPCRCDLDSNGTVNEIDLQLFLEDYSRIY
jgi:hypothetical protein